MKYWKKTLGLSILFVLGFVNLYAQEAGEGHLIIRGIVEEEMVPLANVKITVDQNSGGSKKLATSSGGEFDVQMDLNSEYTITFTKQDYVSKNLYVNTKHMQDLLLL